MTASPATFLTLNGVRHWVRQAGKSPGDGTEPPLVVLHDGPGGSSYAFERTLGARLENEFRLVYYDQRGCGRSDAPPNPGDYSLPLLAADLEALRAALGFRRIVLLGLGFGAALAVEYALAHPETLDGLILDAPPLAEPWRIAAVQTAGFLQVAGADDKPALQRISDAWGAWGDAPGAPVERLARLWAAASPETRDAFLFYDPAAAARWHTLEQESGLPWNGDMARALLAQPPRSPSLLEALPGLGRLPVLVTCGWHDRCAGLEACRDAVLRLARGELGMYQDSAHCPYIEETQSCFHTLRSWISRNVLFNDARNHPRNAPQRQLQMIWPAARRADPPAADPPPGYSLRAFQPGDEQDDAHGFYELIDLAGFGDWNENSITPWLQRILPDGWMCVFHTASRRVVANALALHDASREHPFGGEVGWVTAHPDHRGRGLGGVVSAAATARLLQAGYRDVHLYTEDYRPAAIRTYLKLGYVPFWSRFGAPEGGDEPQMLDRWRTLCAQVNWPYTPQAWIAAWPER